MLAIARRMLLTLCALGPIATVALATPEMIPIDAVEIVGKPAPPVKLALADGSTFDLAAHRGRVVVLSFWASWCGPCRQELPAMTKLAASAPEVDFVAVNVDRRRPDADKFLRQVDVGLPIAFDNDAAALGEFLVTSMPTTFVIDRHGVVRHKKIGFSPEKGLTELVGYIDQAKQ